MAHSSPSVGVNGFRLGSYVCHAGPDDPALEEQHDLPMIAFVREGRFTYHGENGRYLVESGCLLLGNGSASYACSHEDSRGDCCNVVQYDPEQFEEIMASAAGSSRYRFTRSALPASDVIIGCLAKLDRQDDAGLSLLHALAAELSQHVRKHTAPTDRERQAIRAAIDLIEADPSAPLGLNCLAAAAGMSRFHFARTFREVMGTPPHRFILARRLAAFAHALRTGDDQITTIALACGFGDLSTFNARFRRAFGQSPSAWRHHHRAANG